MVTAVADKLSPEGTIARTLVLLAGNGVILVITMLVLRAYAARIRRRPTLVPAPASPGVRAR
jgi:hypothetical protein